MKLAFQSKIGVHPFLFYNELICGIFISISGQQLSEKRIKKMVHAVLPVSWTARPGGLVAKVPDW